MLDRVPTSIGVRLEDIALDSEGWRDSFAWPVPFHALFQLSHRLQRRFADLLAALEGDERDVMVQAKPLVGTAIVMETALALQEEQARGLRLIGPPELAILRGTARPESARESSLVHMGAYAGTARTRHQAARRLVRTLSWTPLMRLPATLAAPQALAVSHNPLLVAEARRRRAQLGFRHAASLLDRIERDAPGAFLLDGPEQIGVLADRALAHLTDDEALTGTMRRRTAALLRAVFADTLTRAARTLGALRNARRMPPALWSGTGGHGPVRALGIEVRRRGGAVTRFDHGGTMSLLAEPYLLAHQELHVSTDYVMPSETAARQTVVVRAADLARPSGLVSIAGGQGDPGLDPGPSSVPAQARRPRVLFVGTAYYGFAQTYPPFPPAPVYLDWQHRILGMLGALPIELVHKPHPGGLFRGRPPGLDHFTRIDDRLFEQAMRDADCLVFDIAASTTFSIALSSDRRIVLLDFGCMRFSEEVWPMIQARCRVVPVVCDDRNRATVDADALEAAVCAPGPAPDPTPFRRLFLADGEAGH